MLHRRDDFRMSAHEAAPEGMPQPLDLDRLLSAARRQIGIIVGGAIIGLALGIAYIETTPPLYTASTTLLIDRGQPQLATQNPQQPASQSDDDAEMLSQVALLQSEHLARIVIDKLDLTHNETFMGDSKSLLGSGIGMVRATFRDLADTFKHSAGPGDSAVSEADRELTRAIGILSDNLRVQRIDKTYVIDLDYTAPSPDLASRITAAYGQAYLEDQLQAKYDATRRVSAWLEDRIAELKRQAYGADLVAQKFRADHGLISAGGELVSEQQLSELNTQLSEARATTAAAKAKLDHIENIINNHQTDAVVNDALASTTINKLHDQYITAAQREAEISRKLGPDQPQAISLRADMKQYSDQIFEELKRIAQSYKSEYDVASSREKSLESSLDKLMSINADADETQVRLRELERESNTFKSLYDNFLQSYQQTIQQQSFPITDARIIQDPMVPQDPSFPRKSLVLALCTMLGGFAGCGMAGLREHRDRFLRSGEQVREEIGTEFLGFAPILSDRPAAPVRVPSNLPGGNLWPAGSICCHVRTHPLSSFAETLRNAQWAADTAVPDEQSRVIGVVSALPSEGKSTIAANLSVLLAVQGRRVLLIDGDLRNPDITRSLARRPSEGLVDVLLKDVPLDQVLQWDASGALAVLPAVPERNGLRTAELLASARMQDLISMTRTAFDYIIVDLPPLGPVIDAKAFARRADAFVFVSEWGRAVRPLVRNTMLQNPGIGDKCLGIILNKADPKKLKLYRKPDSLEYYSERYRGYYTT